MAIQGLISLSIDDLVAWVGPSSNYSSLVMTPNLDRLAAEGTSFSNAYTAEAICNPSRTAVLSGQSPMRTGVHANDQNWFEYVDPSTTLPAAFMAAGYAVGGYGKIFHTYVMPTSLTGQMFTDYTNVSGYQQGPPATSLIEPLPDSVAPDELADQITIDHAIAFLEAHENAPFFLNVGLLKPHLGWIVPQAYYDLYPLDAIEVPGMVGDDMSAVPAFIREQLTDSRGHPTPDDPQAAKVFLQAYLASVSYMDDQVGRLLDALDALNLSDSTAIVAWSDHGYHLGDRDNLWGKFTLWEEAAKVPLIFKVPGVTTPGTVSDEVVNLLDLYPTLTDLAGVDAPVALDGRSLASALRAPGVTDPAAESYTWMMGSVMLRTGTHAYIRYEDGSEELYDMVADPDQLTDLSVDAGSAAILLGLRDKVRAELNILDAQSASPVGDASANMIYVTAPGQVFAGQGGDDHYYVNSAGSLLFESAGGGTDTIFTTRNIELPAHFENLVVSHYTGTGVTRISGNDLANSINGGPGSETIRGHDGDDRIVGGGGADTILGDGGHDQIIGYLGADQIHGGAGNDLIRGNGGADLIFGDEGDDALIAGATGSALFGNAGLDRLYGGAGNDFMGGGPDADSLYGAGGDDRLYGNAGADLLDGGAGFDYAGYTGSAEGVSVNLFTGTAAGGDASGDRLSGIEGLIGSEYDDVLVGDNGANVLAGGSGADFLSGGREADTIYGGDGDDRLYGAAGGDLLEGGAGFDFAGYTGSDAGVTVNLFHLSASGGHADGDSLSGIEGLIGSELDDILVGDGGANVIAGGGGGDFIGGGAGDDTVMGGAGEDRLYGSSGADLVDGGAGFDYAGYTGSAVGVKVDLDSGIAVGGDAAGDSLVGIEGLIGSEAGDQLAGDTGDNTLIGAGGADMLIGGAGGTDLLIGGPGADLFVFRLDGGQVGIADFATGEDRLLHLGGLPAGFTAQAADENGDGVQDTVFSSGAGVTVVVYGTILTDSVLEAMTDPIDWSG